MTVSPGAGTLVINASQAGRLQGRYRCWASNTLGTALSPETRVIAESETPEAPGDTKPALGSLKYPWGDPEPPDYPLNPLRAP